MRGPIDAPMASFGEEGDDVLASSMQRQVAKRGANQGGFGFMPREVLFGQIEEELEEEMGLDDDDLFGLDDDEDLL
jgi:hypothetical protein